MQRRKIIEDNRDYLNYLVDECTYLELPSELAERAREAIRLIGRKLEAQTVHLALVGGFSAGKSTLINAILGEPLLTSRANPTTICPTYISYGHQPRLLVNLTAREVGWEVVTEIIREVTLHGDFLTKPLRFAEAGSHMYQVEHVFATTGEFHYEVRINGTPLRAGTIEVWEPGLSVLFCYSELGHRAALAADCLFLPEDRAPRVKITGDDGQREVVLHDVFLSGEYRRAVFLEPGAYGLRVDCDWDYLNERYSTVYRKRSFPTKLHRFIARLTNTPPYVKEKRQFAAPQEILRIAVPQPGRYLIAFNVSRQTLHVQELKSPASIRRYYVMNSEEDTRLAGALIARYTAAARREGQRDYEGIIDGVKLEFPSPRLQQALTIIDTPGISAEEEHTKITLDVINQQADACMFLCPADQAGTLSDLRFISEHVEKISGDIFFAITKTDMAGDEEELREIVDVVREKIREQTGIKDPKILAVSPLQALRAPHSREGRAFYEAIDAVTDLVDSNRDSIMVRRLLKVEHSLMELLSERARTAQEAYYARLQELKAYQIQDIKAFIEEQKLEVFRNLEELFEEGAYLEIYRRALTDVAAKVKDHIRQILAQAESTSELKEACEGPVVERLGVYRTELEEALRAASTAVSSQLNGLIRKVFRDFEERFEAQYSLKRLTYGQVSMGSFSLPPGAVEVSAEAALTQVNEALGAQNAGVGLGMAGGAIVGSMILPGIGTIIGGLLGSVLGNLFGPPIKEVRRKVFASIVQAISDQLNHELYPQLENMIAQKRLELNNVILETIEQYVRRYDTVVRRLIEEHEQKKREIERYVNQAKVAVRELKKRQQELDKLASSLAAEETRWVTAGVKTGRISI